MRDEPLIRVFKWALVPRGSHVFGLPFLGDFYPAVRFDSREVAKFILRLSWGRGPTWDPRWGLWLTEDVNIGAWLRERTGKE